MSFLPFVQGIGLGAGMIIPIGAQNSYVLNQAVKRNYHFVAAAICIVCDITLMGLGVFGGAQLIGENSLLHTGLTWGGIIFLSIYGFLSLKAALQPKSSSDKNNGSQKSLKGVILTTLAVTLLNPHVYLDTVVILGSVGNQFIGSDKTAFALGIMMASVLWFTSLSLGGAKLSKQLSRKRVKQSIDFSVGVLMWSIAFSLFQGS
jgi:L-lysine exporter family protein LysE/ArgO